MGLGLGLEGNSGRFWWYCIRMVGEEKGLGGGGVIKGN